MLILSILLYLQAATDRLVLLNKGHGCYFRIKKNKIFGMSILIFISVLNSFVALASPLGLHT